MKTTLLGGIIILYIVKHEGFADTEAGTNVNAAAVAGI